MYLLYGMLLSKNPFACCANASAVNTYLVITSNKHDWPVGRMHSSHRAFKARAKKEKEKKKNPPNVMSDILY